MQADLLQATGGLVLDLDQAKLFKVADQLRRGDEEGLTRILFGLAALHRLLGRGCGNLDAHSLLRTEQGRLVLVCDPSQPSRCETTARNDVAGRYFLHLGEQPCGVDDLISLGVLAGELLVQPNKRPSLSDAHAEYREELAEQIPKTSLHHEDRVRNRLVKSLLLCASDSQLTASEFLRDHVALVKLTSDTRLKPASRTDAIRQFLTSSLFVLSVIALSLVALLMLWRSERSARVLAQHDLETSGARVAELQLELEKSQKQTSYSATIPPPKRGQSIPVEKLSSDPRYTLFSDDVNLRDDPEIQRLLKQTTLTEKDVTYADGLLNDLVIAAKVWWKIAESEVSDSEVIKLIVGQTNSRVSKILKVWYAQAVTSELRIITLKQSLVPSDHNTYRFQVSFHDLDRDEYVYGNPSNDLFVQSGNTLRLKSGGKPTYSIRWKAGQAIPFWLEYWYGYRLSWLNVLTKQASGALALPLLAKRSWQQDGFSMSFDVSPLPGPPIDSAFITAGGIPMPGITRKSDLPLDIADELK